MPRTPHHFILQKDSKQQPVKIDLLTVKKADIILRTLNHGLRIQIINLLQDRGETTVTEIYNHLRLEQSVASQHLALLRRADIVATRREGKFIWYTVNADRIEAIFNIAKQLVN